MKSKRVKKKIVKKTIKNIPNVSLYLAPIGCWNCNIKYSIHIPKGINTPEFLMNVGANCKKCGCNTLKMLTEYNTEKKILKDLILHHRLEGINHEGSDTRYEHYR